MKLGATKIRKLKLIEKLEVINHDLTHKDATAESVARELKKVVSILHLILSAELET